MPENEEQYREALEHHLKLATTEGRRAVKPEKAIAHNRVAVLIQAQLDELPPLKKRTRPRRKVAAKATAK